MLRLTDQQRIATMKWPAVAALIKARRKVWQTLLVVFSTSVFAAAAAGQTVSQPTSGVYLTAADYQNRHLTTGDIDLSQAAAVKLRVSDRYIEVTQGSKRHRFEKDRIFGFRSKDGRDYRFASNRGYEILEAKELYIYAQPIRVSSPRGREDSGAKQDREYYFSLGPEGKIRKLTLANLKQETPNNHRFHDLLDTTLGAGHSVGEYDEFHKMFKVNRLLIASRE